MMRMHFNKTIPALVAAVVLVCAGQASAHKLSATKVAGVAKRAMISGTHASSASVKSCRSLSAHRRVCKVEGRYSSGAKRCTADITVSFTSRTSNRMRWSASNFVCY
jgi:hypothetical protein